MTLRHRGYMGVALAVLLALQPAMVLAQPTSVSTSAPASQPTLRALPDGTRLKTRQGTFQGYNLEEFKTLLRIYADYRSWGTQLPLLKRNAKEYQELTSNLTKQLKLQGEEVKLLQTERTRLLKKWTEENRLRHLAENKVSWWAWVGWGSAAVMTVVTAVLVGIVIAKE